MLYYCAFSGVKHMGAGQFYLFITRDTHGDPLDGSATYRLHVPPNAPVKQYWSAMLYDFATHCPDPRRHAGQPSPRSRPD